MRIGIYDPYLDDMGGGEKYMLTMASCLSEKHDVSLFWDEPRDLDIVLSRFSIDLSKVKLIQNIFSPHVSTVKRLIESMKFDAIIVLSDGSIPTLLSKKTFIHAQQPLSSKAGYKTRLKLMHITKVFCNSYFTKGFIDKDLGVDSIVLYPPVSLKPKKIKKENIILHVGRFRAGNVGGGDYKKQGFILEEFMGMVKKGLEGWKLVIASGVKSEDEDEFNKLINKAGKYPVEFLVNKSNDELWETYSKAKIYWHASGFGEDLDLHPELAEHFGISTVEAMGAGCVPVVINAGGQKEIVEDNVSGFLWNTKEELVEKTNLLIKEGKILEEMSGESIKRAKNFTGDRFCDEVYKLIC